MRSSFSKVSRAEQCLRLWAWGALDQAYEPQKKQAKDGDELHALNEAYVRYGMPYPDTPMGRLAALGASYLPSKVDEPLVEEWQNLKYGPFEFSLKADLMWWGPVAPIILDYKSVAHFGFIPTPAKLRMDLQANGYAFAAMKKYDQDSAMVVWMYFRRREDGKEPNAEEDLRVVETVIERENALRVLRSRDAILRKMQHLQESRPKPRALEVVGNEAHCPAYGGCWYRPKCFPGKYQWDETGTKSIPVEAASVPA